MLFFMLGRPARAPLPPPPPLPLFHNRAALSVDPVNDKEVLKVRCKLEWLHNGLHDR